MKQVYTNQNIALVGASKSYLEENGIACRIRNEFSSGVMGDMPFADVWPELWVADDNYTQAKQLIGTMQQQTVNGPEWFCHQCKESNPGTFELCWQCGTAA
ncbi:MAG: DUF2007 domain-containing protein [Pseudomonadota bacterium]